jgi:hypothetical protein
MREGSSQGKLQEEVLAEDINLQIITWFEVMKLDDKTKGLSRTGETVQ